MNRGDDRPKERIYHDDQALTMRIKLTHARVACLLGCPLSGGCGSFNVRTSGQGQA